MKKMFKVSFIEFIAVKELIIETEVNSHGYGVIAGIISCKGEEKVIRLLHSEEIEQITYTMNENKQEVLFSGYIESSVMDKEGNLLEVKIRLIGATKKMDMTKKTVAFQNVLMSYEQLIKNVNRQYGKNIVLTNANVESTIDNLIVQYNETDWEFVKRIATRFNTGLYPQVCMPGIVYSFGVPEKRKEKTIEIKECSVNCAYDEYREKIENGLTDLIEEDCWIYTIKTRERIELGEEITYQGKKLRVKRVCANWEKEELIYIGELVRQRGLSCVKRDNEHIIGASLDAYVSKTSADKVQVKILCDAESEPVNSKWFMYSTIFSSSDGTGWYCMPEEGDRVRLYFPDEKEENGYIISSVHETVERENEYQEGARTNPDNKSIATKYGKQIELTPTQIILTNNKGMQIVIDDNEGIQMICDKNIVLESQGEINVVSANEGLTMAAIEAIELVQGNSKVILKDDIIVEGAKFKVQ